MRRHRLVSGLCALLAACGRGAPAATGPAFDLTLRPVRSGAAEVSAIEVRWELRGAPDSLTLSAPIVYAGVTGIADRIERLTVRDRSGLLAVETQDDPAAPGGFPYFRHWRFSRPIRSPVTVTYRARIQPDGERNGPPFSLRASGGGVSGAGPGFLLLPDDTASMAIRVAWDLGDLGPGAIAVTSYGEGDVALDGTLERVQQAWYLAGPAGRYPVRGDTAGFSAAWLGAPPFDAAAEMRWTGQLYAALARAFGYLVPAPRYRVFMRFLAAAPCGGGTALEGSFMLSRCVGPADTSTAAPRDTFIHELVHQWVGQIEGPRAVTSWFSEGLTTHYARLLPMRGGLMSVDWYGARIAESTEGYYGSPGRNLPADSIAALGFGNENIRHVPYHRGALYFASLDARIRRASQGRRTLDDLMRGLFERRLRGARFDHEAWVSAVTAELGAEAGAEFEAVILRGETLVPPSDAFGPCFARRERTYRMGGVGRAGFAWVRVAGVPESVCRGW